MGELLMRRRHVNPDYKQAVLDLGPVGYWRLGELAGTVARDEMGRNNGTYVATPTLGAAPLLAGEPDTAVTFDGLPSSEEVTIGNPEALKLTTGTIVAWLRTAGAGAGFRGIVVKQDAYGLFLNNNVLSIYDWGAGAERSTGVNLADSNIHQVAETFRSGVASGTVIYKDGSPVLTTTITVANQTGNIRIAASDWAPDFGQHLAGTIDEVTIFARALTADEIAYLHRVGMGR